MINKTELRLGNTVLFNKEFTIIDGIDQDGATTNLFNDRAYCQFMHFFELDPIPITADILIQSKFKKDLGGSFEPSLTTNGRGFRLWFFDNICKWNVIDDEMVELRFVHELQNLFFALYKEEIDIYP